MKAQIKGFSMVCMAALLLLAASCKKETKEEPEYEGGFTAKAEAQQNDSKVYLVGTGLEWNNDESIMVFNSGGDEPTSYKFTSYKVCIDEANFKPNPEAEFSQSFYRNGGYTAYYPCDKMTNNGGTVSFTMDATQTYTVFDNHPTFDRSAFLMAGKTGTGEADDRFIYFKNLCGLLELSLYSTTSCTVQKITITSNDPNEHLNGKGTVSFPSKDDAPVPTLSALDGSNKLTLTCSGVTLGTNEGTATKFYFVVPAGTLGSGFTVKVTDPEGYSWERTASGSTNQIVRNQMTKMPACKVTISNVPENALPKLFSVGTTTKEGTKKYIYFSKGNLQYHCKNMTWRFAEHQYSIVGDGSRGNVKVDGYTYKCNNYNIDKDYDGWIDLFGFGTSGYAHGATCYQPYSRSQSNPDYYIYGINSSPYPNLYGNTGVVNDGMADWGMANSAALGPNWRTPTKDEWQNLVSNSRVDKDGKPLWGLGKVKNVLTFVGSSESKDLKGLIVLPDEWNWDENTELSLLKSKWTGGSTDLQTTSAVNVFTESEWKLMEDAGALFLPAAGTRNNKDMTFVNSSGFYWSSSVSDYYSNYYPFYLYLTCSASSSNTISLEDDKQRLHGHSVRLVHDPR